MLNSDALIRTAGRETFVRAWKKETKKLLPLLKKEFETIKRLIYTMAATSSSQFSKPAQFPLLCKIATTHLLPAETGADQRENNEMGSIKLSWGA